MGLIVRHIPVPAGSMLATAEDDGVLECALDVLERDEVALRGMHELRNPASLTLQP